MEMRTLGRTGLEVSRLGAGCSWIGNELSLDETEQAGNVLNAALDAGINFLDTSACYGNSEELIGLTVAHRRDEYVLATKCGHAVRGYEGPEWTADLVTHSIDRSLRDMKTDYLDIVQLHGCGVDVLEKGEVTEALLNAQNSGKTRFIGYSGDNEAAEWAIDSGIFDTLQTSYSVSDQRARTRLFEAAKAQNMGIIAKRPIANGAWGATSSPSEYADEYFRRYQIMAERGAIPGAPDDRFLLALGFIFGQPEVDIVIVGTLNPSHMRSNLEKVKNDLPIPDEAIEELRRRFEELDDAWVQET
jgi:aryl-alcohol dehydrogenase-like predicted oxidoreductase